LTSKNVQKFLRNAGLLLLGLVMLRAAAEEPSLYVFYPSASRPQIIQKELAEELPGISIIVFGRYVDFIEKTGVEHPTAILTKQDVIAQLDDYLTAASGTRAGLSEEPYLLVSTRQTAQPYGSLTIGVVDFLGRSGMDTLAQRFFAVVPKIKRVTKVEDLLPLLSFGMADAVLVSPAHAEYLAKASNLPFVTKAAGPAQIGIIALAVRKNGGDGAALAGMVRRLSKETNTLLGIDGWK
jgi:hypothetical protein